MWNHIAYTLLSVLQNCYFVNSFLKLFFEIRNIRYMRLTCLD